MSAWAAARAWLLGGLLAAAVACDERVPVDGGGEGGAEGEGEGVSAFALIVESSPDAVVGNAADSAAVFWLSDGRLLVAAQVTAGTTMIAPGDDDTPIEAPAGYDIAYISVDPSAGVTAIEVVNEADVDDAILASDQSADGTAWLATAAGRHSVWVGAPTTPATLFLHRFAADGTRTASVSFPTGIGLHSAALAVLADGGVLVHAGPGPAGLSSEPSAAAIARLDASGALVWAAILEGGSPQVGGVTELDSGNLAVAGTQLEDVVVRGSDGRSATIPCAHATGAYLIVLTADGAIVQSAPIDTDAIAGPPHLASIPGGFVAAGYISGTVILPGGSTIAPQGRHIAWAARFGEDLLERWAVSSTRGTADVTEVRTTATEQIWLLGTTEGSFELGDRRVPGAGYTMWGAQLGPDGAIRDVGFLDSASQSWLVAASRLDADAHLYLAAVSDGDLATPLGPIEIAAPSLVVVETRALAPASVP